MNIIQLMTYYSLGKWIVDVQQGGKERAEYGKQIIKKLSDRISETLFTIFEEEHPFIVTWSHYLQLMKIRIRE